MCSSRYFLGLRQISEWLLLFLVLMLFFPENAPAQAQHTHKKRPALATWPAIAPNGDLYISGVNSQGQLFLQASPNNGMIWRAPVTISTGGDTVLADGQNRPKLVFLKNGDWLISYTTPLAKPYTGNVKYMVSKDGGLTFSQPQRVHQDNQIITHRFESLALNAQGLLNVFWIDKRDLQAQTQQGIAYRGAAVYGRTSTSEGEFLQADFKVADHSCECCQIAAVPTKNGDVALLWRHVFEPNIRDHAFARIKPATESKTTAKPTIVRSTFDNWAVDACPHQGPAMVEDPQGNFHIVWFGVKGEQAGVRYAKLDAQGKPLGHALQLPDAGAEFADIAFADNTLAIVWRSFNGQHFTLSAWVSTDRGKHFSLQQLGTTTEENDAPRLFKRQNKLYVLWRTSSENTVHSLEKQDLWQRLLENTPRPAAVVFTATDCTHCPAVITSLAAQKSTLNFHLATVVMDAEPLSDAPESKKANHYALADAVHPYSGKTHALQYAVNPKWRGVTPYVALLKTDGSIRYVLGQPSPQQLEDLIK